jgi:hypothetical protein
MIRIGGLVAASAALVATNGSSSRSFPARAPERSPA